MTAHGASTEDERIGRMLAAAERRIADLEDRLGAHRRRVKRQANAIERLEARIRVLEERLAARERRLRAMERSRWWRLRGLVRRSRRTATPPERSRAPGGPAPEARAPEPPTAPNEAGARRIGTFAAAKPDGSPVRVLAITHDPKFFGGVADFIAACEGVEFRMLRWPTSMSHDVAESRAAVEWADAIVCEWCLENLAFASWAVRPDQRLVARLHRFELGTGRLPQVRTDRLDCLIVTSEHILERVRGLPGWDDVRIVNLWNWIDLDSFDLPKDEGAPFVLGLLGYAPRRKRLDRALDLVEALRARDDRYVLRLKGKPVGDLPAFAGDPEERSYFEALERRISASPLLRDAVQFDPFGPDVGKWFRGVGFILSVSEDEGNQYAVLEGMASGAVPVVLDRPGARETYPSRWVHASIEEAAGAVVRAAPDWVAESAASKGYVRKRSSDEEALHPWLEIVLGDLLIRR